MKSSTATWRNLWESGQLYGDDRPAGRVTVEVDWELTRATGWKDGPVRWFYRQQHDIDTYETEVPGVKSIQWNKSLDQGGGTCTITLYNQKLESIYSATPDTHTNNELGFPGYLTFSYGESAEERGRWGHALNEWNNVLTPNALIRTWEGYGGHNKTVKQAVADGDIFHTGTWLVDTVDVNSEQGTLTLTCRDMSKLLIEQFIYPPIVPNRLYPDILKKCGWNFEDRTETFTVDREVRSQQDQPLPVKHGNGAGGPLPSDGTPPAGGTDFNSESEMWYGFDCEDLSNGIHGHRPSDAFDGNPDTFWLGVGNSAPDRPFAVDFLEGTIQAEVNAILVHPFLGNYTMFISVEENGQWVDGADGATVPYDPSILFENGNEPYGAVDTKANIYYVKKTSIPWETPTIIDLPRRYNASKIRLSFRNLQRTQWGPYYYRAGVRRFGAMLRKNVTTKTTEEQSVTKEVKVDGNTTDYAEIVKQFLLWAGWEYHDLTDPNTSTPTVYGSIENTGARPEFCIDQDTFDRKTVWDAINTVRDIVGYNFYINDRGEAVFVAPNIWAQGNFLEDRTYTEFIPQIDEKKTLVGFREVHSDRNLRTSIVISSNEPTLDNEDTITARFTPPSEARKFARGMERPFMWVNENFQSQEEMEILAELAALRIWFKSRQQQGTIVGNPTLEIDDQIRLYERQSGQTYVLYINGLSSSLDMDSGQYTMTLTTNWLGTKEGWAIDSSNVRDVF